MPYERLEFLGDRVLGLVIAEWLYEKYPQPPKANWPSAMRRWSTARRLRAVAKEIGLGDFLRLARGEDAAAARKNLATLPDAMEAVIGALYLDGGLKAARDFIHRYWQRDIAIIETPADPKTRLQEWAQGQALPLPQYKVIEHSGPAHAPKFIIEASVKGHPSATAEGDSNARRKKKRRRIIAAKAGEKAKAK